MTEVTPEPKLNVTLGDDYVATVELTNGDYNFFDMEMLLGLADTFEALDHNADCRAILLCADGKAFCAGADFQDGENGTTPASLRSPNKGSGLSGHLYDQAVRLFATKKPIVAAIHGAAIGGGLGLALVADLRVGCPQTRMAANFTQLGIHPGFGLSFTLPRIVGQQSAYDMFYTGRRVPGEEAFDIGLLDQFVDREDVRATAHVKAEQIAGAAPLAVTSVRETLRGIFQKLCATQQIESYPNKIGYYAHRMPRKGSRQYRKDEQESLQGNRYNLALLVQSKRSERTMHQGKV